jgi:hypothetical protein
MRSQSGTKDELVAIHDWLLVEHGGDDSERDANACAAALYGGMRPGLYSWA